MLISEEVRDKEIYNSEKTTVYRGIRQNRPVIIKTLRKEYPDPIEIEELKEEYEILLKLKGKGIIRALSLEKYKKGNAIIFEDIGGRDLAQILQEKELSLIECLEIMHASALALGAIHKENIVHRDIKSHNIVFNEYTKELQIIDLGSASFLLKHNSFISMNSSVEGTLAYISPEQTGRMNRTVDYRTDFYSLGITFYQILTGELPFLSTDPMEMVHAHLAKVPISPFERKGIPIFLSEIVMKLMQKNPEDRYQNILGLVYDLEWCLENIKFLCSSNEIESFPKIASNDFSLKFQIPEKLYGRSKEIIQILKSFKKVMEGNTQLILISGRSGIGKSVLINEINKPIIEYKGYLASGKYDQFKRTIPYYGITRALQNLLSQILTENQDSILVWKNKLLSSLGNNGQLLIDVIPELENLIGEQPPIIDLGPSESQNRFTLVFQNFIKAFCRKEHPIAIFLDDLQWADPPSIQLLQSMISNPEMKFLLLIFSFRDNELLPSDSFSIMLNDLEKNNFEPLNIELMPLSINEINHLVSDTLHASKQQTKELATILHSKTKGNPFFVNEMFKSFYDKEFITYSKGKWAWDIDKIQNTNSSENVIDLLVEKVKELRVSQAEILKLAACIGDSFNVDILFKVSGKPVSEIRNELTTISNEGFLIITKTNITFVHDKIREATYTLIGKEEKIKNHYLIGKTYLASVPKEKFEDFVFTIVEQMNQGFDQVNAENEKNLLFDLNILAGNRSLASLAYQAAFEFYTIAVRLRPENSWVNDYKKTLNLFIAKAKSEYLSNNFEFAEITFELILKNAKNEIDKINVYELKSALYTKQLRMKEALNLTMEGLNMMKVSLPKNPTELSSLPEIIKAKIMIGKKNPEFLVNLPFMKNERDFAIIRLLNTSIAPAYLSKPLLFPVIVMKMVNLSIKKGLSPISPFSFIIYGLILGSGLGDFKSGYEWGKLTISLLEKNEFKSIECRTLMVYASAIQHWKNHAKNGYDFLLKSIQSGIETGDLEYTSYSLIHIYFQTLAIRKPLKEVLELIEKMKPTFLKIKQDHAYYISAIVEQVTINLKEVTANNKELVGKAFDEKKYLPAWIESNNSSALHCYFTLKCMLGYFFDEPEVVDEYSIKAKIYEKSNLGTMFIPEIYFFESLNLLSLFKKSKNRRKKKKLKSRLLNITKKMKIWGKNCEANYGHKSFILEGLVYELEGNYLLAQKSYKQAIILAKKHDYILEEAIANERIASIWRNQDEDQYELIHLVEAHYAYRKWGAEPKVNQLEKDFPALKRKLQTKYTDQSTTFGKTFKNTNFLDFNTVVKASQTLSSEIHLGKLLEKMTTILFENAGAERVVVILKKKNNFYIEAEGNVRTNKMEVLQHKLLNVASEFSTSIVNYVTRTKKLVLLNDGSKADIFLNDNYILNNKPKSILCYPIVSQGNLVGVVYLENNLVTEAFTPDRIEVLEILSSQIAVSIENSLLYTSLEEKVEERTKNLNKALTEVRNLKEQQDGDYFLNTLLIEPLAKNNANSPFFEIDFFTKQKKEFIFRKGYYELGGDINISENLILQKNKYIVFLNGDAMGKSIQGAGGVLVLGTVFKSIIHRTMTTDYGKSVFPEKWLKDAFIEMHNTFMSFDGSMLMSIIFGLIDERTGVLYFLNAEHPDIVLYRNEQASFIKCKTQYTKLGTQDQSGTISVEVFSMLPGDSIITGSDGRDDLIIGVNPDNPSMYIINEDYDLFLRHVEQAEGDVNKIYNQIKSSGDLIDDISLCKIYFKGSEFYNSKINLESTLKQIIPHKTQKNIEKFIELSEGLISDYPHLTNYLFEISNAYKELGQYNKAIEFAERVRIREPKNFNNLLVLLESYYKTQNEERARIILNTCNELNSEDKKLNELINNFNPSK